MGEFDMTHRKIFILACVLLMLAAMSSSALAVNLSDGCNKLSAPVTAGQVTSVAVHNEEQGGNRSYALFLPTAYVPKHPTALVIGLHGWTGTGSGALRGSR